MMRYAIAAVAALSLSAPAWAAEDCAKDVELIDAALAGDTVDADIRAQAEDMRNQAVQLCGAGNTEEGLTMTAEAKTLLQIDQ